MAGEAHSNHGNTIAAWTAVGVIMIGAFISSLAVVFATVTMFVVGLVVCVVGVIVGKVLSKAGYGATRPEDPKVTRAVR